MEKNYLRSSVALPFVFVTNSWLSPQQSNEGCKTIQLAYKPGYSSSQRALLLSSLSYVSPVFHFCHFSFPISSFLIPVPDRKGLKRWSYVAFTLNTKLKCTSQENFLATGGCFERNIHLSRYSARLGRKKKKKMNNSEFRLFQVCYFKTVSAHCYCYCRLGRALLAALCSFKH